MRVTVYLAGDIGEEDRWRPKVVEALQGLDVEFLSPVDKGIHYTPKALKKANKANRVFLHCDYMKVDKADIVFAYLRKSKSRHSGTSAEIGYGKAKGKMIVLVNDLEEDEAYLYEFIKRTADEYFTTLDKAIDYLVDLVDEMQYSPVEK